MKIQFSPQVVLVVLRISIHVFRIFVSRLWSDHIFISPNWVQLHEGPIFLDNFICDST